MKIEQLKTEEREKKKLRTGSNKLKKKSFSKTGVRDQREMRDKVFVLQQIVLRLSYFKRFHMPGNRPSDTTDVRPDITISLLLTRELFPEKRLERADRNYREWTSARVVSRAFIGDVI